MQLFQLAHYRCSSDDILFSFSQQFQKVSLSNICALKQAQQKGMTRYVDCSVSFSPRTSAKLENMVASLLESPATVEAFRILQVNTGIRIDLAQSYENRQPLLVICDNSTDNPRKRMFAFYDINFPNQISLSPKFRDCVDENFTNNELMFLMAVTIAHECCHFLMRLNNNNERTPKDFLRVVKCSEFGYFWEGIVFEEMQLMDEGLCLNVEKFDGHFCGLFRTFNVEWAYKFGMSFLRSWTNDLSWFEPEIFRPKHWFHGKDLPLNLKLSDQKRTAVLRKSYVDRIVNHEAFLSPTRYDFEILKCPSLEFKAKHVRVARMLEKENAGIARIERRLIYDAPLEERCRRVVFQN
jgi:hypothetical protein